MRYVRAVSMGERITEERAEDTSVKANVVVGDTAVRISDAIGAELLSSGRPRIADKRLWMKVFKVGSNREYMKVAFEPFHTDVAPLVDQSCEITSKSEDGFLIESRFLGRDDDDDGI